jgi:hypothetical protein
LASDALPPRHVEDVAAEVVDNQLLDARWAKRHGVCPFCLRAIIAGEHMIACDEEASDWGHEACVARRRRESDKPQEGESQ